MGKMKMRIVAALMSAVFATGFAMPAHAQATLDDVLKRVEALEKENAALKSEVQSMKATQTAQAVDIQKASSAVASATGATAPTGNFLKTKFETELYGMIKADVVWSDSEANPNNTSTTSGGVGNGTTIAYNAPNNGAGNKKHMSTFNAAAQDTRLGLNLKAPKMDDGGQVTGKIEFDFAHSAVQNATSGTYTPRLRLAYADLSYDKWGVRAGQDWDFFAPVNTSLLNSGNAWRAGNIGYRHPMAYLTNRWGEFLAGKWTTKIGVIDTDDWSQENSGTPVSAVYAQYDTKIIGVVSSFGVGGVYGKNNSDTLAVASSEGLKSADTYGVVANTTLKFTDWLALKAKGYQGAKLDKFQVNNGVGFTNASATAALTATTKALHNIGGYTELTYNPIKKVETNFGLGYDGVMNPKETISSSAWSSNKTYWTNVKYSLTKDLLVGLEYQHFDTKWITGVDSSDNRVESSFILKF